MLCAQELREYSHAAPMRLVYTHDSHRFHMLVIHVGEVGVASSSMKLLAMIADELELAIGGGVKCPCYVPAQALRKALAWCVVAMGAFCL